MMHSGDEYDEFFSVDRFSSIKPNQTELLTKKPTKIIKITKKFEKFGSVRREKIELIRLSLVRFDSIRNPFKIREFHCIKVPYID
jgi:hypothetical protein